MNKQVLIIGGKTQTKSLAESLLMKKYEVTVINEDYHFCKLLSEINGIEVIHGNGGKPYVLEDANVGEFDIAIAMNDSDADNLIIGELCKYYGVKKVIAVISDPKKTDFFYRMGIDSVVCATTAIAGILEQQAIMDELATIVPIGEGRIRLTEVTVPNDSPIIGETLAAIPFPKNVIIGCILRENGSIVPSGDTRIADNDTLLLITRKEDEGKAIKIITGR